MYLLSTVVMLRAYVVISCGNSGDSADQKMACALAKEMSPRLLSRGDSGDQNMACTLTSPRLAGD